jgi:NAD(P)-dependent dehydrogenase (short-subunit alcohol dehydrogenase family)
MSPTTVLLTGATDGLGRALADRLAQDGVRLILHGRSPGRLDETADELAARHRIERPVTLQADFASLAEVAQLAADVRAHTDALDVLVNNVGMGPGLPDSRNRQQSADGYELRLAVNYLAPFRLTLDLLDLLRASAPPGSSTSSRWRRARSTSTT